MKNIIYFTILLLIISADTFSQSVLNYQTGTGVVVQPGADICADQVIINGTFSGGGTICGGLAYVLNLTALIQGFYNSSSNTMVPDTVTVYLRNAVSPFAKKDSVKSVLNISGAGTFVFDNATNGTNYYIVITHRNSIDTWSSSAIAFTSGVMTYDLTTAASKAYGFNQAQVDISPVKFAIYGGDINRDGTVDVSDIVQVYNGAVLFSSGYVITDVNGDNFTDVSDVVITYNNSVNFVTVIRP